MNKLFSIKSVFCTICEFLSQNEVIKLQILNKKAYNDLLPYYFEATKQNQEMIYLKIFSSNFIFLRNENSRMNE